MTKKPVFMIGTGDRPVITFITETECAGSASKEQKQTSVQRLHDSFKAEHPAAKVLEISPLSQDPIGRILTDEKLTFECSDGRTMSCREAMKTAVAEYPPEKEEPPKKAGAAKETKKKKAVPTPAAYVFAGRRIDARPPRLFFTWLFIRSLAAHRELLVSLLSYDAFSEYSYAFSRRINTPAFSAAVAVWLERNGLFDEAAKDPDLLRDLLMNGLPKPESKVRRVVTEWMPKPAADSASPGNPIE
ncbi:MAG: hypothetical protein IKO51_09935 [Clostridia bacterium]|nr:hypothetical protein [Clostridia bacterium]